MKAIILCAGEWSRLRPLTHSIPKCWIEIAWKPIVCHLLDNIKKFVSEAIIVVKYKEEEMKTLLWNSYKNIKISYHTQGEKSWTGWALEWIHLDDDMLFLYWDQIIAESDIQKVVDEEYEAVMVKEVPNPEKFWIFKEEEWFAIEVVEKPKTYIWNLANFWVFKFKKEFLDLIPKLEKSERWEYEVTDALNQYIKTNKVKLVKSEVELLELTYPWDILKANEKLMSESYRISVEGEIEEGVIIEGSLALGKNSKIKAWVRIEGSVIIWDASEIWPGVYLKGNIVIWDNCKIVSNSHIEESQIWNNAIIHPNSMISNSIICEGVNIWSGTITACSRHDWENVKCYSKWELVDTKRSLFWAIISSNVKTWANTTIYPWRIVNRHTMPWEIYKK